jgi:hypothetical protein
MLDTGYSILVANALFPLKKEPVLSEAEGGTKGVVDLRNQ